MLNCIYIFKEQFSGHFVNYFGSIFESGFMKKIYYNLIYNTKIQYFLIIGIKLIKLAKLKVQTIIWTNLIQ